MPLLCADGLLFRLDRLGLYAVPASKTVGRIGIVFFAVAVISFESRCFYSFSAGAGPAWFFRTADPPAMEIGGRNRRCFICFYHSIFLFAIEVRVNV